MKEVGGQRNILHEIDRVRRARERRVKVEFELLHRANEPLELVSELRYKERGAGEQAARQNFRL